MEQPLVSVIIPVYNGERFVGEAIESVLKQGLSASAVEIIVIDDGSTDGTTAAVDRFGDQVRCHRQPNRGAAAARNTGLAIARGELIGLLDSDDLYADGMLQATTTLLQANPAVDIVMGYSQYLFLDGADLSARAFRFADDTRRALNLLPSAGLYRRSVFGRVGGFDETLPFADDFDWFARAREQQTTIQVLNQVTQYYRFHNNNLTNQVEKLKLNLMGMLKKSLDRRRPQAMGNMPALSTFPVAEPPAGNGMADAGGSVQT